MTGLNRLIEVLAQQREQLGPPAWGHWTHANQTWSRLAHATTRVLHHFTPVEPTDRASQCILANLAMDSPEIPPTPGAYQSLSNLTQTLGSIGDLLTTAPADSPITRAAGTIVRSAALTSVSAAAEWTLHGLPKPPRGFGMLASQLDRLARAPISASTSSELSLYPWRAPTPGQLDHAVDTWHRAVESALTSTNSITQLALQLTAADIALICLSAATSVHDSREIDGTHHLSNQLAHSASSWRDIARWPANSRLGGRTEQLRDASATLRSALAKLDAFNIDSHERLQTLLWSTRIAQTAGTQHAASLEALARGQQAIWLLRRQAISDSRRRPRKHLNWTPSAMPSTDGIKLLLRSELALHQITAVAAAVDGHIASTQPGHRPAEAPVWEIVTPPPRAEHIHGFREDNSQMLPPNGRATASGVQP